MNDFDPRGGVFARFLERVERGADRMALVGNASPTTYGHLLVRAAELANRLPTTPRTNQRVGLLLVNGREFVAGFMAVAARGGLAIPLNPRMTAGDLAWYDRQLVFDCLFTTRALAESLVDKTPGLAERTIRVEEGAPVSLDGLERLVPGDFPDNTPAVCLSTSGTTGKPKLVVRSHASLIANARAIAKALAVKEIDRFSAVVPFCHAYGLGGSLLVPLLAGASLAPQAQFSPRALADLCRDVGITVLTGSPMIYSMLAESTAVAGDFASVRHCLSSGARLAPAIARRCRSRLGLTIRQLYGSSEMGTVAIGGGDDEADTDCVGTPLPGVDVRIAEGGADAAGEDGEVLVRSPAMMRGYLEDTGLEPASLHDGFFHTGDVGRLTATGALRLAGRRKRMINVCGINVDPVEIETVLQSMPGVKQARASARLNDRSMETIAVALHVDAGVVLGRGEVVRFCRGRLAEYKIPRAIEFVDASLLKEE